MNKHIIEPAAWELAQARTPTATASSPTGRT